MKNIKYVILGMFILFIIIFLSSFVFTFNNRNRIIHVNKYEGYDKTREELSKKIDKVKNVDCKNSLNDMLERIDSINFTTDVKLKDYYEVYHKDDKTFLDFYTSAADACNINNEKIYIKALQSTTYPIFIGSEYNNAYELRIRYVYDNNDEIGTYTTIVGELGVLSDLLEELS